MIDAFPRAALAHRPTPLERLPRLSAELGVEIRVKRDDCTGLAFGGNKARQLEFYFGEALARGADTVLITGAVQSNYVRSTAAAAAKLGLACHVQLEDRVAATDDAHRRSGNVLLDRLLGAEISTFPEGEDEGAADAALEARAARLEAEGRRPYVIHLSPSHPPLGALAYVEAAGELLDQAEAVGDGIGSIVIPSGTAQSHAGLLVGLAGRGRARLPVLGACVRRPAAVQAERVARVAAATRALVERPDLDLPGVWTDDRALASGYGRLDRASVEALRIAARLEGLLLDPVYTAKALATAIGILRSEPARLPEPIVFWHTGGTPALFGYEAVLGSTAAGG